MYSVKSGLPARQKDSRRRHQEPILSVLASMLSSRIKHSSLLHLRNKACWLLRSSSFEVPEQDLVR